MAARWSARNTSASSPVRPAPPRRSRQQPQTWTPASPQRPWREWSVQGSSRNFSFALTFPSQLRPVIQPLADFALKTAVRRIVEGFPSERFRKIVLPGEGVRRIVVVFVTRTIAFRLHQLGRRIENMFWRQQRTALFRGPHCRPKRLVGG